MEGYMQIISGGNYISTSKQPQVVAPLASKQCGTGEDVGKREKLEREKRTHGR